MLVVRPEFDIKLAIGLTIATVYSQTVARGRCAVGRILWIPALAKIGSFPTLGSTSSTPAAICPARVEEAGEAGRGERPVVLRDPETASLSTLRSTGAPLMKRVPALNAIVGAASAVRPCEVEPARAARVCRGVVRVHVLLAGRGGQQVELVARCLGASLAPSELADVLPLVVHLRCAPVLLFAIGVLDTSMAPLTSLDARTRVLDLGSLKHLARLQHPALAVLHRDGAHRCRGHTG